MKFPEGIPITLYVDNPVVRNELRNQLVGIVAHYQDQLSKIKRRVDERFADPTERLDAWIVCVDSPQLSESQSFVNAYLRDTFQAFGDVALTELGLESETVTTIKLGETLLQLYEVDEERDMNIRRRITIDLTSRAPDIATLPPGGPVLAA